MQFLARLIHDPNEVGLLEASEQQFEEIRNILQHATDTAAHSYQVNHNKLAFSILDDSVEGEQKL
jgi:hypothetical protein